jgi:ribosomal protein S18 acetylase RimI-like enzyme
VIDPAQLSFRPAAADDFDFLWQLHREALREAVAKVYGWDDEWQLKFFQERFNRQARQIILFNGQAAGSLGLEWQEEALYIAYIALNSAYQGQGIGTVIIEDVIRQGREAGLPVTLGVLKGNPAKRLYDRLGFVVTKEEKTRYLMACPV